MTATAMTDSDALASTLRAILLDLARREDECAALEAAEQRYWEPCPPSVHGHLAAAVALRGRADQLLASLRGVLSQSGVDGR